MVGRLVARDLPFSTQAIDLTLAITPTFPLAEGWTVSGKTGTGFQRRPDGTNDRDRQLGWFIGWARQGARTVIFARLIEDSGPEPVSAGLRARDTMLADVPVLLRQANGRP
jgi:beta-lactamase class D